MFISGFSCNVITFPVGGLGTPEGVVAGVQVFWDSFSRLGSCVYCRHKINIPLLNIWFKFPTSSLSVFFQLLITSGPIVRFRSGVDTRCVSCFIYHIAKIVTPCVQWGPRNVFRKSEMRTINLGHLSALYISKFFSWSNTVACVS